MRMSRQATPAAEQGETRLATYEQQLTKLANCHDNDTELQKQLMALADLNGRKRRMSPIRFEGELAMLENRLTCWRKAKAEHRARAL